MSTNPNNAVGTNGAFGGRTSVNAFNDVMGALSRGILSGWACVPNSGLTVSLGGNGTTRDTAIAEDNAGNKTSINNISNSPINVTIGAAPGANSRIDAIVAYVDNPPTGNASETDNPDPCGLIVVEGTVASTPVVPTEAQIRTGITADGASGTTAYYVVLAYVTMASGTTDITSSEINAGELAQINGNKIENNSIVASSINFSTFDEPVVVNSNLTALQSTTSTSGVNVNTLGDGTDLGNLQITLSHSTSVIVCATFPLSTTASNAYILVGVDGGDASTLVTNQETLSHSTTGFVKINNLSPGVHTFTFKLGATSGETAYIGAYRTISVALLPVI